MEREGLVAELVRGVIKSDGKLRSSVKERLRYRREILEVLSKHISGFRQGTYSTVYVPPAYPLDGFVYQLKPLVVGSGSPEEVYARLVKLLRELQNLQAPFYSEGHRRVASMLFGFARAYGRRVYHFADRYMAINRSTLIDIARVLAKHGSIPGSISAIKLSAEDKEYIDLYRLLYKIKVGKHESDKLIDRVYSISRVYDGVLVMSGAACHYGVNRRLAERITSYILSRTPFTPVFMDVMFGNISAEEYVEAFKSFVECAVREYPASAYHATLRCAEKLAARWRRIGVETMYPLDTPLLAIYAIIEDTSKGFTY